jgi:pyruvate/2-oxoglutarate dehydrogenase complex dihydrolipoamide acyltransferase (E2) component
VAKKVLEITLNTAKRLGFYNEVPAELEGELTRWFVKKGEVIGFIEDKNTGARVGQTICSITTKNKNEIEIDAQGWEVGATVSKLLMAEGEIFSVNLYQESLRLLEAETIVSKQKTDEPAEMSTTVRISPLAKLAAEKQNISLQELMARFPPGTEEITLEDVGSAKGIKAAPATRQRAKELGANLADIHGTGPDGIVKLSDVYKVGQKENVTPVDSDFEILKPGMRRLAIAQNMARGSAEPLVHPAMDIDAAPMVKLRSEMREFFENIHGVKLRFDYFFVAACSWLLLQKEFRILNSGWYEENGKLEIRLYKHVNIGLAVAIPPEKNRSGLSELVVPVIKHAEKLTFVKIVKAAEELLAKERLGTEDLNGLTFTINNVGSPGLWRGIKLNGVEDPNNPIVPSGTCALLGMGTIREENWQKKMRLVLGFNHKIVDGYEVCLFLGALRYLIEHPEQILALK